MRQRVQWGLILIIAGLGIMALALHWGHVVSKDALQGFLIGFLGMVLFGVLGGRLGNGRWRMKVWMWSRRFFGPR